MRNNYIYIDIINCKLKFNIYYYIHTLNTHN